MSEKNVRTMSAEEYLNKHKEDDDDGIEVTYDFNTEDDDEGEVWDSGMTVLEAQKVIVPEEVRRICMALQNQTEVNGQRSEFGVLFKGEWTEKGFEVKPDYIIPEQEASRAHITYTEDLKKYRQQGYIVNAHSHPWAGHNSGFSGTDDDHINSHFDVAILYAGNAETIVSARANIEVREGIKLQLRPTVEVQEPEPELPDVNTDNIDVQTTERNKSKNQYSGYQSKFSYNHVKDRFTSNNREKRRNSSNKGYKDSSDDDYKHQKGDWDIEEME